MKDLSIKVTIANRVYPLTIQQSEEVNIRSAAKAINEMVKDYEQNYAVKDRQDLLAMCALQFATQKIESDRNGIIAEDGIEGRLRAMESTLSAL